MEIGRTGRSIPLSPLKHRTRWSTQARHLADVSLFLPYHAKLGEVSCAPDGDNAHLNAWQLKCIRVYSIFKLQGANGSYSNSFRTYWIPFWLLFLYGWTSYDIPEASYSNQRFNNYQSYTPSYRESGPFKKSTGYTLASLFAKCPSFQLGQTTNFPLYFRDFPVYNVDEILDP